MQTIVMINKELIKTNTKKTDTSICAFNNYASFQTECLNVPPVNNIKRLRSQQSQDNDWRWSFQCHRVRGTLGALSRFVRRFFFPMRRGRRIGLPDDAIVKSSFVSRQRVTQQRPRRVACTSRVHPRRREMRHDDVRASSRQIQLVLVRG